MQRQSLTATQQRYFNWIKAYIDKEGRSPSIQEVREGLHYTSNTPVSSALWVLRSKGWITWEDGKRRTIRIVGQRRVSLSTKTVLMLDRFREQCRVYGHDFEQALMERLKV